MAKHLINVKFQIKTSEILASTEKKTYLCIVFFMVLDY